jgi:thymidylate synthase (FAD)
MKNCKIIAITNPLIDNLSVEEFVAYVARVSNPSNQSNTLTSSKLLKYLIKNKHFSPFEMVNIVQEVNTTRDIARQILRHRSFSFQEFCLSGDALITTIIPSSGLLNYISIKNLFEKRKHRNYKNILIRVYDEELKIFKNTKIKEVFNTGIKSIFQIKLEDNKIIKCTKEEKFFTEYGFDTLENIVGLELTNTNKATMSKIGIIGINGHLCYQNYEWLKNIREESPKKSLLQISEIAGVSYHTIRKWLKIHNLQYTKKEVAEYSLIWNKGKFGYKTSLKHSETHINAIKKARTGENSNWWKGGVDRSERLKIADWCQTIRRKKLEDYNFCCNECNSNIKLELDHKIPVWEDISKAYNYDNIQVLCEECHKLKHNNEYERKEWRKRSKGNTLVPKFKKIISIEYIGEEETYDLEVENTSHNFIANKIMVHNSQRYADPSAMGLMHTREARLQDTKNRQNSIETTDEELQKVWEDIQNEISHEAIEAYKWAIDKGIAKEQARVVLPEGLTPSRLYMNGSLRSYIHYCSLRMTIGTQKEHREIAAECWNNILEYFPSLKDLDMEQ